MATKQTVVSPDMLNAVRAEASPQYREAVPRALASNLAEVGNPIINYEAIANEFLSALMNKIVMTWVERRMYDNQLAMLRDGLMPLGATIEDVHINPAEAQAYDGTEAGMATLLKMSKPDVATAFYTVNRQDKYPVTVNNEQLIHAFTSWANLENLIAGIVDSLYNGNAIDEFLYTKKLISEAVAGNKMQTKTVVTPTNTDTGKAFMKELRTLSTLFTFPSTAYNNYQLAGGATPRTTWSSIADQIIIIRADVASAVGVDVLAGLFHTDYADYLARQVIVDEFEGAENVLAVLADKKAFVIKDQLRKFTTFYNGAAMNWNYWYHAWDLYAFSPFRNAVALVAAAGGGTP